MLGVMKRYILSPSATPSSWCGLTTECGRHGDAAEWRRRKSGRVGRDGRGWVEPDIRLSEVSSFLAGGYLVCGKAAVGEFLQTVAEIEADVEIGAQGAGEHGHDGGDGWAAFLGAQMHPVLSSPADSLLENTTKPIRLNRRMFCRLRPG
jgi:hypothetical protein